MDDCFRVVQSHGFHAIPMRDVRRALCLEGTYLSDEKAQVANLGLLDDVLCRQNKVVTAPDSCDSSSRNLFLSSSLTRRWICAFAGKSAVSNANRMRP